MPASCEQPITSSGSEVPFTVTLSREPRIGTELASLQVDNSSSAGNSIWITMKIARLATIIGLLLVVASLANGSVSYLKRVGWLEHGAYTRFMETYCSGLEGTPVPLHARAILSDPGPPTILPAYLTKYIYANNGYERLLKICKDLLFAGFFVCSCYLIQAKRARLPDPEALLPPLLLLANVGVGFLISLFLWGSVFALAGLRSFGFLAIALVGGWAFSGIQGITRCVQSC